MSYDRDLPHALTIIAIVRGWWLHPFTREIAGSSPAGVLGKALCRWPVWRFEHLLRRLKLWWVPTMGTKHRGVPGRCRPPARPYLAWRNAIVRLPRRSHATFTIGFSPIDRTGPGAVHRRSSHADWRSRTPMPKSRASGVSERPSSAADPRQPAGEVKRPMGKPSWSVSA